VHDPDISHRELAVFIHGLLSANKNDGERIWHRAETVAKATGVGASEGKNAGKDVSRIRTLLWKKGLFTNTGKRRGKLPIYTVNIPQGRLQCVPIPFGLRSKIHMLLPSELRLLLYMIIGFGWTPAIGCVNPVKPADAFADAALPIASAYRGLLGLLEKKFLVIGQVQISETIEPIRYWFVTRKAGFAKPPIVPTQWIPRLISIMGDSQHPYSEFDWRELRGALTSTSNKAKER
jgi:hypothetical protein